VISDRQRKPSQLFLDGHIRNIHTKKRFHRRRFLHISQSEIIIGPSSHVECSWRGILDTTIGDKVCPWLAAGQWFSPGTLVSSTNKTDCHDITEILLKVVINTINLTIAILIKQSKKKPSSTLMFCFSI
jgi:hypothetical protein